MLPAGVSSPRPPGSGESRFAEERAARPGRDDPGQRACAAIRAPASGTATRNSVEKARSRGWARRDIGHLRLPPGLARTTRPPQDGRGSARLRDDGERARRAAPACERRVDANVRDAVPDRAAGRSDRAVPAARRRQPPGRRGSGGQRTAGISLVLVVDSGDQASGCGRPASATQDGLRPVARGPAGRSLRAGAQADDQGEQQEQSDQDSADDQKRREHAQNVSEGTVRVTGWRWADLTEDAPAGCADFAA